MTFDPNDFGPAVAAIIGDGQRLTDLGPGSPVEAMRPSLVSFNPVRDLGPIFNREAAQACYAGLWLYYDFQEEAHAISQELHTPEGSAWHAIIHRREPDAWNSQYWWAKVGMQPWMERVPYPTTAKSFVDECEKVRGSGRDDEFKAKAIQLAEWQELFRECWLKAITDSKR